MLLINILIILSINLLIGTETKTKNKIILIILLVIGFITLNLTFKTFKNSSLIYIILLFSLGIILTKLFEKYAPINGKIKGSENFKKFRFVVFRIIFPFLITVFQILLLSNTKLQKDILDNNQQKNQQNLIKAIK